MSTQDNGGPAFPQMQTTWDDEKHEYVLDMSLDGMSLRDYFAAKALQSGWLRNTDSGWNPSSGMLNTETIAFACYEIADAMLKARQS